MLAAVRSAAIVGIDAYDVTVEVDVAKGLPAFTLVGLASGAVKESRERVIAALANAGLALPPRKTTVNLSPADRPKNGTAFDLPIALGLMAALGAIPADALGAYVVLGELNLDGTIGAVSGALPAAIGANAQGKGLICPADGQNSTAQAGFATDAVLPSLPKGRFSDYFCSNCRKASVQ